MSEAIIPADGFGRRANQTRSKIVAAARDLFLLNGYAGTSVSDITDACGISRAGFYTYFQDKLEVFSELGRATYRSSLGLARDFQDLPTPWSVADVAGWLHRYLAHLDTHGPFILAATVAGPNDEGFRADARHTSMKVAAAMGRSLVDRGAPRTAEPAVLGLVLVSMLEESRQRFRHGTTDPGDEAVLAELTGILVALVGHDLAPPR